MPHSLPTQAHELTRQPGPQANGTVGSHDAAAAKGGGVNGAAHTGSEKGQGKKGAGAAVGDGLTQDEREELEKALAESGEA